VRAGLIVTAGGMRHAHSFYLSQLIDHTFVQWYLAMLGGGTGLLMEPIATTIVTPGAWNVEEMLEAARRLSDRQQLFFR